MHYSPADRSWLRLALGDVTSKTPFVLDITGSDAHKILTQYRQQLVIAPELFHSVLAKADSVPLPASVLVPTSQVVSWVGSFGALGGALGSVAVVCLLAHFQGFLFDLKFRMGSHNLQEILEIHANIG